MKNIYRKILNHKDLFELLSYAATIISVIFIATQIFILREIEQNRIALESLRLLANQDYAKAIGHVLAETKKIAEEKNEKLGIVDISNSQFTEQYNFILRTYYTLAFLYESEQANPCLLKKVLMKQWGNW